MRLLTDVHKCYLVEMRFSVDNLKITFQGYILTSEIDGAIQMKSYLTGNPEIKLALNEDLSIGSGGGSVHGTFFTPYELTVFFLYHQ
jgi:hypothetical protein